MPALFSPVVFPKNCANLFICRNPKKLTRGFFLASPDPYQWEKYYTHVHKTHKLCRWWWWWPAALWGVCHVVYGKTENKKGGKEGVHICGVPHISTIA